MHKKHMQSAQDSSFVMTVYHTLFQQTQGDDNNNIIIT